MMRLRFRGRSTANGSTVQCGRWQCCFARTIFLEVTSFVPSKIATRLSLSFVHKFGSSGCALFRSSVVIHDTNTQIRSRKF